MHIQHEHEEHDSLKDRFFFIKSILFVAWVDLSGCYSQHREFLPSVMMMMRCFRFDWVEDDTFLLKTLEEYIALVMVLVRSEAESRPLLCVKCMAASQARD